MLLSNIKEFLPFSEGWPAEEKIEAITAVSRETPISLHVQCLILGLISYRYHQPGS